MRPSTDPSGEIDELARRLQAARSPWEKVKVLTEAWRTVRKLSPQQRFMVAKHVGLEGAETFLEKLGDPYRGLPTADLLDIVRAADAQDFARWKEIVGGLRRREEREALLRNQIKGVRDLLLEPTGPDRMEAEDSAASAEAEPSPVPASVEVAAPPREDAEDTSESDAEEPIEEEGAKEAEFDAPEEVVEVAPLAEEDQGETAEGRPEEGASAEEDVGTTTIETGREPDLTGLMGRLTASDSLVYRMRQFRTLVEEMRSLDVGGLARLLECLPDGWARRRALCWLLRERIPEDFEDGLCLVKSQGRISERMWCYGALIESRPLTEEEEDEMLESEGSPLLSRRLRLRLAGRRGA